MDEQVSPETTSSSLQSHATSKANRKQRARRARRRRAGSCLAVLFGMFLSVALVGLNVFNPFMQFLPEIYGKARLIPTATATPTSIPTPQPTPIPSPTINQLHTLHDGCADGRPAPEKNIIVDTYSPGHAGPPPKEVALTFDDGPTPYSTPAILSYLEKTHTPATFFVEGQFITHWPDLLQREWNDGFAIGVHTWDHPNLRQLSPKAYPHEIGDTLAALHTILGADACIWLFRPPYGEINGRAFTAAYDDGLTVINWDASGLDWTLPGSRTIARLVLSEVHPGAIILLHDGPAGREETLNALPLILAGLKADGLKPVPLPKLLADAHFRGVVVPNYPIPAPIILPVSSSDKDIPSGNEAK